MTLCHNETLDWVDSATDEARHHGLTAFGRAVIAELNRLGMMVDLAHVSPDGMSQVLDISKRAGRLLALERPRPLRIIRATCPMTCSTASRPMAAS